MNAHQVPERNRIRPILLLALVAFIVVSPILFAGVPHGNDLPQHYQFAFAFKQAIAEGTIYPSWSGPVNHGLGDVGIRFYPPASYYLLVGAEALTEDWYNASVLTFFILFFAGGVGVYLWCRESYGNNASLLAAVVYAVAPYHVNQIFNAFTYAEFAAAAILPFCFLFVKRISRNRGIVDILLLAGSYALLVLTHLPMTVIGSIALCVYSVASLRRGILIRTVTRLGVAVLLGLAASSFYWIRMVTELSFVGHSGDKFRSEAYDFHTNFLAAFLYVSPTQYLDRSLWFTDLHLVMALCLFVPGLVAARWFGTSGFWSGIKAPLITLASAIFVATPLSLPIWERATLLQQTQFPWRGLAVISLMACYLAAAGFGPLCKAFATAHRPLAILGAGLLAIVAIFTASQVIRPAMFQDRAEFTARLSNLATAESYECWWPVWADRAALTDRTQVSAGDRSVSIQGWSNEQRKFTVDAGEELIARIGTFYYPLWRAEVNGEPAEILTADDGAIYLRLPAVRSEIALVFSETAIAGLSKIVAAGVWFGLIAGLLLQLGFIAFTRRAPRQRIDPVLAIPEESSTERPVNPVAHRA